MLSGHKFKTCQIFFTFPGNPSPWHCSLCGPSGYFTSFSSLFSARLPSLPCPVSFLAMENSQIFSCTNHAPIHLRNNPERFPCTGNRYGQPELTGTVTTLMWAWQNRLIRRLYAEIGEIVMNTRIGVLLALVALGLCCAIGPVMADNNGNWTGNAECL